jgi:ABC-2 type transport system ATP-binding protein
MLSLQHLTKRFGRGPSAVEDVSVTLIPGVVGLIGHNGAGKSTLMQMIATISKPSSGSILLEGDDIIAKPERMRRRLGYLPQDFGVYANLDALEALQYFAALKGVRDPARVRHVLELVNLHEHARRMIGTFSGGMRQRLGIAQALLNDPDVLVVDEPTAGLDPEERVRFRQLLAEIGFSKLVIVSTHIVSDVESLATHLVILKRGRLSAFETPAALLQRAEGKVWAGEVSVRDYERDRGRWQVLQSQREADRVLLRVAQDSVPFAGARACTPSLEEALMALRYVDQGQGLA